MLFRGLVCEGEREDAEGVHVLGEQVRDANSEHAGLAAARTRDHHVGPSVASTAASWAGFSPFKWSMERVQR
jgi:hypothetical protein